MILFYLSSYFQQYTLWFKQTALINIQVTEQNSISELSTLSSG